MSIKEQLDTDLKAAMLAGQKDRVTILRGLKSAILYIEVAKGARESGLPEAEVMAILTKEAKKRQESADLYVQGGNQPKADDELAEKLIIEAYLPAQLTVAEVSSLIDTITADSGQKVSKQTMGAIITAVKQQSGGAADGAMVARLVKERIDV